MSIFRAEVIGTATPDPAWQRRGGVRAVELSPRAQNSGWIVITFGWGMAVMVGAFAVGQFSGAHLNPAVTSGFAIEGSIEWDQVPEYFAGEFVGAFIGATLVWLAYLDHWKETEDPGLKLACLLHGAGDPQPRLERDHRDHRHVRAGVRRSWPSSPTRRRPPRVSAPLIVGLLVLGIGLSLGGPTGYAINPARDLGPRIMHAILPIAGKGASDWGYAWIPVVAPLIGGALGGRSCSTRPSRKPTASET